MITKAYNDSGGVTADFNLNLLRRINAELGGTFDLKRFSYFSTWDPLAGAVQSFLLSRTRQRVFVRELNRSFDFQPWEPIHTESSYKFSHEEISGLASRIGFEIVGDFYDSKRYFIDSLWQARKDIA